MCIRDRTYAVATDYTCIPFWEETELDAYFVPHEDLKREFAGKGIPQEKLIPTGIPISRRCLQKTPKAEARDVYKRQLSDRFCKGKRALFARIFPQELRKSAVQTRVGHTAAPIESVGDEADIGQAKHPVHICLDHAHEDDPYLAGILMHQPAEQLRLRTSGQRRSRSKVQSRINTVLFPDHRTDDDTFPADGGRCV